MPDDQVPVTPHDKRIPATLMNTLIDVAKKHRRGGSGRTGAGAGGNDIGAHALEVMVSYASTLPVFSVLTYSGTVPIDPATRPLDVSARPVLNAAIPAATTDAFVITLGPIPFGGGVVSAVAMGVAVVGVDVTDASHGYATPSGGITANLVSATTGPARILYKPSGTGVKTCVVEVTGVNPPASTGGSVWHAVLTEATGAATWQERRVDSGGTWADTGSLQGNSAYPVQLEGGSFAVKPTAKVIMWADPVTGSYYDLLPVQSAHLVSGTYYAGYVIDGAQTWRGTKTFHHAVVIDPEGGNGPSLTMGGTLANPASITASQGAYLFGLYDNTFPTIGTFRVRWDGGACLGEYVEINQGGLGGRTNIYLHTLVGGTCALTCANSGQLDSLTGFGTGGGTYVGQTYTANFGGMTLDFNGGILIAHSGSFTAGTVTSTSGGTTGITFTSPTTTPTMTGTLVVANGGTGLATVTTNGVLYGNGTGALGVTSAPTSGQLLIGGSAPDFKTMSGDATITSAGVLTIGNAKVTLAKIANAAASSKLIGSGASGSGAAYVEITLGTGLTMTGTTLSASGGSPGGSNTHVQFNDSGSFGGNSGMVYDKTNKTFTVASGSVQVYLNGGGAALVAQDGANIAVLAGGVLGTIAVDAQAGHINVIGTSGNTYRWVNSTSAPSTNAGTPTTRYGGDTNYCGDPDAWILVRIGGTDYKIPAFL